MLAAYGSGLCHGRTAGFCIPPQYECSAVCVWVSWVLIAQWRAALYKPLE